MTSMIQNQPKSNILSEASFCFTIQKTVEGAEKEERIKESQSVGAIRKRQVK